MKLGTRNYTKGFAAFTVALVALCFVLTAWVPSWIIFPMSFILGWNAYRIYTWTLINVNKWAKK